MTGTNIAILMKRTNNQKTMNKVLINIKEVRNLLVIVFIVFRPRWYAWNGWHGWNARHGHAENDVINANGITRRP